MKTSKTTMKPTEKKPHGETHALTVITPTALATPKVIPPKMSKTDVINSLVELARRKYDEQHEADTRSEEAARALMTEAVVNHVLANIDLLNSDSVVVDIAWGREPKEAELNIKGITSPEIAKAVRAAHKAKLGYRSFNEKAERDRIKKALDGGHDRVSLILAQPENIKVLEEVLKKINAKVSK